jgi:hypothetical protein
MSPRQFLFAIFNFYSTKNKKNGYDLATNENREQMSIDFETSISKLFVFYLLILHKFVNRFLRPT